MRFVPDPATAFVPAKKVNAEGMSRFVSQKATLLAFVTTYVTDAALSTFPWKTICPLRASTVPGPLTVAPFSIHWLLPVALQMRRSVCPFRSIVPAPHR